MFGLLFGEITIGDEKVDFIVGAFKKRPEEPHRRKRNPISLFFRCLWRKLISSFSFSIDEKERAKEALEYPEDEMKS